MGCLNSAAPVIGKKNFAKSHLFVSFFGVCNSNINVKVSICNAHNRYHHQVAEMLVVIAN